jgi:hypothetical protein
VRVIELIDGATMPESGLNFIGLSYDPNWMPAFLVFEPNREIFKTTEKGIGFILDVRGIISNMWFTNLMMSEPADMVEKVLEVCSVCFKDNPERLDRLDDLEHWIIDFKIDRFRTKGNKLVESRYSMHFPQYKPPSAKDVGLFAF